MSGRSLKIRKIGDTLLERRINMANVLIQRRKLNKGMTDL
jgi:hypothetical protein